MFACTASCEPDIEKKNCSRDRFSRHLRLSSANQSNHTCMNKTNTKDYTLTFSKKTGKLWMLEDVTPFPKKFQHYFFDEMGHDFCKVTVCGAGNYVLDILASGEQEMTVELKISDKRVTLPDYVEFELVAPYNLSAKYHVNNCPDRPQLEAWFNASIKQIVKQYPPFAYIKKSVKG